jgi:UPF0716 protein FxsA
MLKLLFLFTVVPTLELYLLFQIADRIGGLETIYVVLLTGIIGASMAKREGISVIQQIQEAAANGEPPADKLIEGLMVLVGGILLVTPGVLTDAFGLSFIFPLTRKLLVGLVKRSLKDRMQFEGIHIGAPRPGPAARDVQDAFKHPTVGDPASDDPFNHPTR